MTNRQNWHWDLNIPYSKIKQILKREDDPRFPRLAGTLVSRVSEPKQVFALISKSAFCRRYQSIQNVITSDEWTKGKAAFWRATYLRLSKELKVQGEKVRIPEQIKLDSFDHKLIEKIKSCRKQALMSQGELAVLMGCSQQYISGIEKGREKISFEFLKKLTKLTGERIELVFMPRK